MLQQIRDRSQSMAAKVIVGAVIVTLAFFGIQSLVSLFSQGSDEVAEVNGEPIGRQAVEMAVQRAIRSGQVPADQERQLRSQVIDQMITQTLLDQYADKGGIYLSDAQLDQVIVNRAEFQDQDGHFSADLFRNRLAGAGYTPLSFRRQLKQDLQRQQVQQGLISSEFMLPSERDELLALQNQTRSFRYHILSKDDLEQPVNVSPQDVERYYQQHQAQFKRPEQIKLNYIVLDQAALAKDVDVSDKALQEAYQKRLADAPRRISHIMVSFGDKRTRDEARARLQEVQQKLEQGQSFSDLAAEYSDDATSADKGGDLGVINRGFFGKAFEDAAFSLDKGQVSGIVATDNGLHLLKATAIDAPSFDEMRDELRQQLALDKAKDRFNEQAQKLIDQSFSADDLQGVAKDLGLEIQHSGWVSRDDVTGVLAEPGVMEAAFQPDVLDKGYNSDVIELDDQRRLVLRVADHRQATTLPLDEVRDQARAAVEADMTRDALQARAAELAKAFESGQAPSLDWQSVNAVTRHASGETQVPKPVLEQAFRLPQPSSGKPVFGRANTESGVALIALDKVESSDAASGDASGDGQFVVQLADRLRAQAAIQGLLESLRNNAEIDRR
ncbi:MULTISPECIES: SurA N-terminal domain-containing protein [unclassified Modicisalibacter]|uniref:SurA N-terminal domain-containing protein n=1 Tax=unclassified Modicisalibacter TaxID=2679913 RepID=UPI001CCC17CC|nr:MULTISPECIES: SurA N-terminal domain-containing protein [unclassified Modicisalibacter]MBZ9557009.1 SurA N-terminal domain-containing protein [Modicisalibacter sp. R2A 31.J]MBZ9574277.1 SurA N-terminal domain-containing protein [Modicisalibacter sp. MOD 31.J]